MVMTMTGNVVFMYFYYFYGLCYLLCMFIEIWNTKGGIAASCASYFECTATCLCCVLL
jgi:hypothetical protein